MLPVGPNDLTWFEWLLCAGALAVVAAMIYAALLDQKAKVKRGAKSVASVLVLGMVLFACLIAAFLCVIYGLIRFSNLQ